MNEAVCTKSKRGFTLVELLVVVGIIAVLISILLPALNKARESAVLAQCLSNHKQLMMGLQMYVNEQGGKAPPSNTNLYTESGIAAGSYFPWYSKIFVGRYIGNRSYSTTAKQDAAPVVAGGATTPLVYCPAQFARTGFGNSPGIGINVRNTARITRNEGATAPQLKWANLRRTSNLLIFVDVYSGFSWEKFYYDEPWPANNLGGLSTGMVTYRHGRNTVASFADGHAEAFQLTKYGANQLTTDYGKNDGLHAAYNKKQVTFVSGG